MTDESTMKLTDFDYLIGDHHLQMVKAAIPYVNVTGQRFLSFFVKLRELQRTVSLFREEQVGAMGICAPGDGQKGSPLEIMKAIRPYGNTQEQDLIDMLCNFLAGPRMGGQYPDIVAAQTRTAPCPTIRPLPISFRTRAPSTPPCQTIPLPSHFPTCPRDTLSSPPVRTPPQKPARPSSLRPSPQPLGPCLPP